MLNTRWSIQDSENLHTPLLMSNQPASQSAPPSTAVSWREIVARYQKPAIWHAVWQITNTFIPYAALWYLMYLVLPYSFWLAVPLSVLAGAFMVRMFIIFHDCGHG